MTTYSEQQETEQTERVEQPYGFEPPVASNEYPAEVLQRQRFGGPNWGAGFFGWLVTVAVSALLATAMAATLLALGTTPAVVAGPGGSSRPWITAAAVALLVVMLAYFCGGYVAGRMSRFDGGKQGFAVWIVGVLLTGAVVGLALLLGPQVELPVRADLPTLPRPVPATGATAGVTGLGAAAVALVAGLLGAVLGGKVGCRYHRKVDDAAYV